MPQQCIGQSQIAFGIFKIDRVYFMRHGGRTDFAGFYLLLEISQGNVAPDISIEVDQNGIESREGVE